MAGGNKDEFPPLLPLGFHPKSLADVRLLCVARFPNSLTRAKIMDGLEHVVGVLNSTGVPMEIWVDGSFATEKLNPNDCDFAVRIMGEDYIAANSNARAVLSWAASTDLVPAHKCDCYVFSEFAAGHKKYDEGQYNRAYWLKQFGFSRSEKPKGLAVIKLPFVIT